MIKPTCHRCGSELYVSEHFFFDTDGIFVGCRSCHYGNMFGNDEPALTFDPDDLASMIQFKNTLAERAKKLLAQKETPPELPSGGVPLSIHDR